MRLLPVTTLRYLLLFIAAGFSAAAAVAKEQEQTLPLKEFIQQATENDTIFETILIDQLPLQYRRAALLPDKDWIVSLKQQFHVYLNQDHSEGEASLSLSKLFPQSGTDLSIGYSKPATLSADDNANLQVLISQPIAQNAFGKGYQLQDKIIGIENDIIRYQIVEAYEDYLASLTVAYYSWYSAYENLKVGRASLQSSEKLLENILERKRQKIALPIDVNKMKLSLVGKQENLILLEEIYNSHSNIVYSAIRYTGPKVYIPTKSETMAGEIDFDQQYNAFTESSRTYTILDLLEQQGSLEVEKAADDLLPSTNLLVGYELEADDWGGSNRENSLFAGIAFSMSIGRSVDSARYEISKIQRKKTALSRQNKYEELHTNLKNLYSQIQREKKLMEIATQKIKLSNAILKDETENYSFGKVSLNDYIDAVNTADENRFSHTAHQVQLNKLIVEWLRLMDKLVDEQSVLNVQASTGEE